MKKLVDVLSLDVPASMILVACAPAAAPTKAPIVATRPPTTPELPAPEGGLVALY